MEIQNIPSYNSYLFSPQERSNGLTYPRARGENSDINFLEVKIAAFKLESYTFSNKEISDQSQIFEFSSSASRLDLSILETKLEKLSTPKTSNTNSFFDEDGYWGIAQTSERLANFVLMGAGDDIEKLRQGREGILRGFQEAEQIWDGELPDISYKTITQALEKIDLKLHSLGQPVIDIAV